MPHCGWSLFPYKTDGRGADIEDTAELERSLLTGETRSANSREERPHFSIPHSIFEGSKIFRRELQIISSKNTESGWLVDKKAITNPFES